MFNTAEVKELHLEKKLVIAECEMNRRALQLESTMVQSSILIMKEKVQIGCGIYPAVMAVGSVLGFLLLKKKKFSGPSLLGKVLGGWRLFQGFRSILASIRGKTHREDDPAV